MKKSDIETMSKIIVANIGSALESLSNEVAMNVKSAIGMFLIDL